MKKKKTNPKPKQSKTLEEKCQTVFKKVTKQALENEELSVTIKDPMPKFEGTEDLVTVCRELGIDRIIGMLQGFEVAKSYYLQKLNKENSQESQFTSLEQALHMVNKKISNVTQLYNQKSGPDSDT